jgi:hypothetical protein
MGEACIITAIDIVVLTGKLTFQHLPVLWVALPRQLSDLGTSPLQIPPCPSQVIEFRLQLRDHHLKAFQFDPLECFHPFLQARFESFKYLSRRELGRHSVDYTSPFIRP